jgi:hypothetical protein
LFAPQSLSTITLVLLESAVDFLEHDGRTARDFPPLEQRLCCRPGLGHGRRRRLPLGSRPVPARPPLPCRTTADLDLARPYWARSFDSSSFDSSSFDSSIINSSAVAGPSAPHVRESPAR